MNSPALPPVPLAHIQGSVLLGQIKSSLTTNFRSMFKIKIKITLQGPPLSLHFSKKKCKKCCLKAVGLRSVQHPRQGAGGRVETSLLLWSGSQLSARACCLWPGASFCRGAASNGTQRLVPQAIALGSPGLIAAFNAL